MVLALDHLEDTKQFGQRPDDLYRYSSADDLLASRMPSMVKGVGYRDTSHADGSGRSTRGIRSLSDADPQVFTMAEQATRALRASVSKGYKLAAAGQAMKSMSPDFAGQFGMFLANTPQQQQLQSAFGAITQALAELGKNITLTSPLGTGLVPFDLLAPSRLIYPFYSPIRNKLPRVSGQGTSRRFKALTSVSGSGGYGAANGAPVRITMSELGGGSLSTYPLSLPASGTQTALDANIPYKFMGLSESLSWLSQFSGQGFEDIAALANLILMQEFMMAEEYQLLSSSGTAIATPNGPTVVVRTAGSNETPVAAAGSGNSYYIRITATNFFGETVMSAAAEAAVGTTANAVLDVTATLPRGAWAINIYISAAATAGAAPAGRTSYNLQAANVGATKFTIQGPVSTSTVHPPAADTGTSSTNDFEGLLSILDGHAVTDGAVYPAGYLGGYVNKNVAKVFSTAVLNDLLQGMWDNSVSGNVGNGGFRADPAEVLAAGSDLRRLSDNITQNGGGTNYTLYLQQDEVGGIRAGAAVSEFQNPITRSVLKLLAHPWFPQGSAMAMSYQLPMPNSNISNIWEMTMVQDYLAISWPVIDIAFRYSLFAYGALVGYAPMYCGLIQGMQQSATTPYF